MLLLIPPRTEVVVMGRMSGEVTGQTWLVERNRSEEQPAEVARLLVEAKSGEVPLRLLNPKSETVTIQAGTEVATLEVAEELSTNVVAAIDKSEVSSEKEEMLRKIVQEKGSQKGKRNSFSPY